MSDMTQEEFDEIRQDRPIIQYKFNVIRKEAMDELVAQAQELKMY